MISSQQFDHIAEMAESMAQQQIDNAYAQGKSDEQRQDEIRSMVFFYGKIYREFLFFMARVAVDPDLFVKDHEKCQAEEIERIRLECARSHGRPS